MNLRVIIDHPSSRLRKYNVDDGLIWDKIEDFLIANKIMYSALTEDKEIGLYDGVMVLLPDLSPRDHHYPQKDEHIKLVSDLGKFLFEDLKLGKTCLHFVTTEECVNGEGALEKCWTSIDDVTYEELTGEILPEQFKPITISRIQLNEEMKKRKTKEKTEYWALNDDYEASLERQVLLAVGNPNFHTKKMSKKQIIEQVTAFAFEGFYSVEKIEQAIKKLESYGLIKQAQS